LNLSGGYAKQKDGPKRCANTGIGPNQANLSRRSAMAELSPITVARFWSKVAVKPSNNECWLWQGAMNGSGYGNFRMPEYGRVNFSAHRVAYLMTHGDFPPDGLVVRHKCDTPQCVNPYHLEYGTVADNMQDMVRRGRQTKRDQSGENNGAAKLSADDVRRIRRLIESGKTNTAIAAEYDVTHSLISRIRRGRSWAA
jgi:hypothetical protein